MSETRLYLICDACGFFYGDVLLPLETPAPICPDCGEERAWAYPTLEKALQHQAQIRDSHSRKVG